jgi:hypothetical protein
MQAVTHSGFEDVGGPTDRVVLAGIFAAGAGGTTLGVCALLGVMRRLA